MSITVTSGVGACDGHVSVTRLGEIVNGFSPYLRADNAQSDWEMV
jgi:hypothetical protein